MIQGWRRGFLVNVSGNNDQQSADLFSTKPAKLMSDLLPHAQTFIHASMVSHKDIYCIPIPGDSA
jgi:hypothetical protein